MQPPQVLAAPRQGHVNGLPGQPVSDGRLFKAGTAGVDGFFHLALGLVDRLAGSGALFGTELAQGFCLLGNHALLAQVFHPDLIQRLQTFRVLDSRKPVLNKLLQVFH